MQLTEDSFRALARSSPWRFRTLHFTAPTHIGGVEAWLRRPGWLRVLDATGREWIETEDRRSANGTVTVFASRGAVVPPPEPARWSLPHEVEPTYRDDGLVAARPERVAYDDPMFQSYNWVAMLDPVELSHGVRVGDLREDVHHGRRVWRARVWPEDDYHPRCTCCSLLASEQIDADEWGDRWEPGKWTYPDGSEVALDVETGVVVHVEHVGGVLPYDGLIDVEILEVDADF